MSRNPSYRRLVILPPLFSDIYIYQTENIFGAAAFFQFSLFVDENVFIEATGILYKYLRPKEQIEEEENPGKEQRRGGEQYYKK